jgi:hypothetical protein
MFQHIPRNFSRRRSRRREYDALADPLAVRWAAQKNLEAAQIARRIGVPMDQYRQWTRQYPDFAAAVAEGQRTADFEIVQALHKSAAGYESETVEVTVTEDGKKTVIKTVKKKRRCHQPPSVRAAIYWLKNRMSDQWRDKPSRPEREIIAHIRPIPAFMPKPSATDANQ